MDVMTVFRNNVKGFHLELTNKCTLKCPACSRTDMINKFPKHWRNYDLNLEHLKNFLDIDIAGMEFLLCGNYGDPIYYNNLIPLCKWLKDNNAKISIVTNGSYQKTTFWNQLTDVLDDNDEIVWSIDGVPDNFTNYRINADWETIKSGIDIVAKSSIKTTWKYIVFNYNEATITQAQQLSQQLDIKKFSIHKSDRWGEIPHMKPSDQYIGARDNAQQNYREGTRDITVSPECSNGTMHYISAEGYYTPCCYISSHQFYYKSVWGNSKTKNNFDISKSTFTKLQENPNLIEFDNSIMISPSNACKFNCPKQNV